MRAIALRPGTTELHIVNIPEPKIQKPTQVKARVLTVGICGTDREEAAGGRADAPQGEKELIIGHEMIAEIVEVGSKVTRVKPGDFAVFTVRRGCDACPACKAFRSDMCTTGNYTERGIKGRHGFHAEYVIDDEIYVVKVDPSIAHIAVLTEPMSVVEKAIEEAFTIEEARLPYARNNPQWMQGKTAVVAGLGPIGLLASLVFRLRGMDVIGLDRDSETSLRARLLTQMGGMYYNDADFNAKEFTKKYPEVQLILDAAGVPKLDFDLLDLLGTNGLFVLTGVPGGDNLLSVDGANLMRKLVLKNQVMVGSVNESIDHFSRGIEDFKEAERRWPGLVQTFITHRYSSNDFETALRNHAPGEIKTVIDWSQPKRGLSA